MINGISLYSSPTIETQNGGAIRSFIEMTWKPYRKLKRTRKLPVVIDTIALAETPSQVIETQALLAFVVLENLTSTFAHSSGIPFLKGYFRKLPKSAPKAAKAPRYTFEELLALMLAQVNIRRGLRRAISLRNELIHFGLSRRPLDRVDHMYGDCQSLIREYLLRLLEFRGHYLDYSTGQVRTL